jgi:long-chain fatty acid transport protein
MPSPAVPARLPRGAAAALMGLGAALFASPAATAAGFYQSDIGTRGMSRAGAFVAGVNDLSAQHYNPAALTRLRPQAYVNMSAVWQSVDFTRIDYDDTGAEVERFDTVNNEAPPMPIPAFAASHNFGVKNFHAAFGLFTPFAPRMEYPEDGAQRYTLKESLIIQWYAGPTLAYKVGWLSFGAGAYWTYISADYGLDLMICSKLPTAEGCEGGPANAAWTDGGSYENNDVSVLLEMSDPFRFTWNVGLLAEPTDFLRIGWSLLPPLKVEGKGSLEADFGAGDEAHWMTGDLDVIRGQKHTDDDVTVLVNMPLILRQGIEFYGKKWAVEATGVYQRWQVTKELRVTDVDLSLEGGEILQAQGQSSIDIRDDVVIPNDYEDVWSWRLGGQYRPVEPLTLRTGVMYEGSAVPAATQGVSLVDGQKWAWGFGGSWHINKDVALDVGGMRTWIGERNITESEIRRQEIPVDFAQILQTGQVDAALRPGKVVGTGTFSSRSLFLSAGLTWRYGKRTSEGPGDDQG